MRFRTPELFLGCFLTIAVFAMGMLFVRWPYPQPSAYQVSTAAAQSESALVVLSQARRRKQGFAFEEIHHEKHGTIFGDAVVGDGRNAGMTDAIDRVAFVDESLLRRRALRKLGVQHFDRDALAHAVRRRVDRCPLADFEQFVEPPSIVKHAAHPLPRSPRRFVFFGRPTLTRDHDN